MNNKEIKNILKAVKRDNRNYEIEHFGKTLCHTRVQKSKKLYTRKCKHKNRDL
ncbi:MAG: hypothetical protein IJW01_06360 [Paludibacteraceae bacterium]|nr:hypothetical protein [Paludibacteraceae bacterium]